MRRRNEALILLLWLLAVASAVAAIWFELERGGRAYLGAAVVFGALAVYIWYRSGR